MFKWFTRTPAVAAATVAPAVDMHVDSRAAAAKMKELAAIDRANMNALVFQQQSFKTVGIDGTDSTDGGQLKTDYNLSGQMSSLQMAWFSKHSFIGYQTCAMLSQHWLINKCVTMPAMDAARNGYELTTLDGEAQSEALERLNKASLKLGTHTACVQYARMCRLFGVRIAMFDCGLDEVALEAPFNIDSVLPHKYAGIIQCDPLWTSPELDSGAAFDPASKHFYEPTHWRIGNKRVHRSHLVIARHVEVPDILKPTYRFGGIPLPQMIYERVYAAERVADEIPQLAMTKRLNVQKTDLAQFFSNFEEGLQRIELANQLRDNYGTRLIGQDDEVLQIDTSLTDLDNVSMLEYQLVAAAAEIPATKLLGTSPKGFNPTGDGEERNYHEMVEAIQENQLMPLLERHYLILAKSLGLDVQVKVQFKPIDSPSAESLATLNKLKADTDVALINAGVIDSQTANERVMNDVQSGYNADTAVDPLEQQLSDLVKNAAAAAQPTEQPTIKKPEPSTAAADSENWITINHAKVLIEGTGEHRTVVGGAGGKLTGKEIQPKSMSENRINPKTTMFHSKAEEPHEEPKKEDPHAPDAEGKSLSTYKHPEWEKQDSIFAEAQKNLRKYSEEHINHAGNYEKYSLHKEIKTHNLKHLKAALKKAGFEPSAKKLHAQTFAQAWLGTKKIDLNSGSNGFSDLHYDSTRSKDAGNLASSHPLQVLHHEIAHLEHAVRVGTQFSNQKEKETALKVSRYAGVNPNEFMAEYVAGVRSGEKYHQEVHDLFVKYRGMENPYQNKI